jgi:xanthine/uracil permease
MSEQPFPISPVFLVLAVGVAGFMFKMDHCEKSESKSETGQRKAAMGLSLAAIVVYVLTNFQTSRRIQMGLILLFYLLLTVGAILGFAYVKQAPFKKCLSDDLFGMVEVKTLQGVLEWSLITYFVIVIAALVSGYKVIGSALQCVVGNKGCDRL